MTWTRQNVPDELLDELAGPAPTATAQERPHSTNGHAGAFDLSAFVATHLPDAIGPDPWKGTGRRWTLPQSPSCDHHDGAAFIAQQPNGAIVAGCHHNSCAWNWQTLRAKFEPRTERKPAAAEQDKPKPVEFPLLTSAELSAYTEEIKYLVDDVWPEEQGGVISGRFKTLKTKFAIGMAVAGSLGLDFLGRFRVAEPFRVLVMSAESGMKSLREAGKACAASMGRELCECSNLLWSTASPRLARLEHLDALRRAIVANELRGLIVDPTYLALAEIGNDATNVFKMGSVLQPLNEIIRETRCSIILVNHNTKGRAKDLARFDPPDLAEVSMSGFMEWARFWCLLGQRQEWNEEAGQHWLWLRTGGSAGHAGLWHLDVTEGTRTDPCGRRWETSIVRASEGNRNEQEAKQSARAEAAGKQIADDKRAILAAFERFPNGEAKRPVRDSLTMGDRRFNPAFAELCREGLLVLTTIKKANRNFDGYRIKRDSED